MKPDTRGTTEAPREHNEANLGLIIPLCMFGLFSSHHTRLFCLPLFSVSDSKCTESLKTNKPKWFFSRGQFILTPIYSSYHVCFNDDFERKRFCSDNDLWSFFIYRYLLYFCSLKSSKDLCILWFSGWMKRFRTDAQTSFFRGNTSSDNMRDSTRSNTPLHKDEMPGQLLQREFIPK